MMTIRTVLVALVSVLLLPGQPAAGQFVSRDETKALSDIAGYLELVRQYREGDFKAAAHLLLDWKEGPVTKAVDAMLTLKRRLAAPPGSRDDLDVADVEAAVLMHSEAAMTAWLEGRSPLVTYHVNSALRIIEWLAASLRASEAGDSRVDSSLHRMVHRDWYLSMARILNGLMEPMSSLSLLKIAQQRFPDDPQLLLASGSAHESVARKIELRSKLRRVSSGREQLLAAAELMSATEQRRMAEGDYRRILKIDPGFAEARLRLGRVLALTGRPAEAEKELRALLSSATGVYIRHLGLLFLGLVLETNDKVAEAKSLYLGAVLLQPGCQTCRVALAHALDRLGDERQAEDVLMQFLRQTDDKSDTADPWWIYPYGQQIAGEELFASLRDGVRIVK